MTEKERVLEFINHLRISTNMSLTIDRMEEADLSKVRTILRSLTESIRLIDVMPMPKPPEPLPVPVCILPHSGWCPRCLVFHLVERKAYPHGKGEHTFNEDGFCTFPGCPATLK